jgi:hypothetical protein
MTDHVVRLYALAVSALVFFVMWAAIAARPWVAQEVKGTPELAAYEQRLSADAALLARLADRGTAGRPVAPSVRVVTLPPLTTTRTS